MSFSVEDLTAPVTAAEIEKSHYDVLTILGINTNNWKPGAVVRTIIKAVSIVLAGFSVLISLIAGGGFLERAKGQWLTLLARYVYGVDRNEAIPAAGELTVRNSGGGIYSFEVGDFVASTDDGRQFSNLEPFELPAVVSTGKPLSLLVSEAAALDQSIASLTAQLAQPGLSDAQKSILQAGLAGTQALRADLAEAIEQASLPTPAATVRISVRALVPGSTGSAAAGEVRVIEADLPGVSVTNEKALIAVDDEEDADLRTRCLDKLGSLSSNGPIDAYSFAARSAKRPDGSAIGIVRIRHTKDGYGGVDLWLASPSGALTDSDLAIADAEIQRKAVPEGVTARVHSAVNKVLPITYEIWAYNTGIAEADIRRAIDSALIAWVRREPIGGNQGFVFKEAIASVIGSARHQGAGLGIYRIVLTSPAANVPVDASEVPVLGAISGIVHLQAPDLRAAA